MGNWETSLDVMRDFGRALNQGIQYLGINGKVVLKKKHKDKNGYACLTYKSKSRETDLAALIDEKGDICTGSYGYKTTENMLKTVGFEDMLSRKLAYAYWINQATKGDFTRFDFDKITGGLQYRKDVISLVEDKIGANVIDQNNLSIIAEFDEKSDFNVLGESTLDLRIKGISRSINNINDMNNAENFIVTMDYKGHEVKVGFYNPKLTDSKLLNQALTDKEWSAWPKNSYRK